MCRKFVGAVNKYYIFENVLVYTAELLTLGNISESMTSCLGCSVYFVSLSCTANVIQFILVIYINKSGPSKLMSICYR